MSQKLPPSDFKRKVTEAYVDVRNFVEGWETGEGKRDKQVKEQVRGDIDKMIEKNK